MKTLLSFLSFIGICALGFAQQTVNLSMGSGYTDRVFYKLATDNTQAYTASDWEVAFLRTSPYAFATRINDQLGLQVYEVSNDVADWDNIDVTNTSTWTALHNSELIWDLGAFDQGSASYGWGEYGSDHHVRGSIIFVIEHGENEYTKFFIDDYFSGYTFKYAKWNEQAGTWDADQTVTIPNSQNTDRYFNYYNLTQGNEVIAEPAVADWDIVFTKFTTAYPVQGGTTPYVVTGVLHHPAVEVAKGTATSVKEDLTYSADINTIGYDWKSFAGGAYTVSSDVYYYIKTAEEEVYKLNFLTFDGSSTGNLSFQVENVTDQMDVKKVNAKNLTVYPNPTVNKQLTVALDNSVAETSLELYNMQGKLVFKQNKSPNSTNQQTLDLNHLQTGIYLLQIKTGTDTLTKKVILQ